MFHTLRKVEHGAPPPRGCLRGVDPVRVQGLAHVREVHVELLQHARDLVRVVLPLEAVEHLVTAGEALCKSSHRLANSFKTGLTERIRKKHAHAMRCRPPWTSSAGGLKAP